MQNPRKAVELKEDHALPLQAGVPSPQSPRTAPAKRVISDEERKRLIEIDNQFLLLAS